ncbi:HD domain-containing protein [Halarcobacter bivalviorum]|uniref:HD superfamily phosphohydrolase n=1 Tax=Halarcobacter bivalviorum TaxID=663364 RepID=A0AB33GH86_9BACT|nr:HD domain-containing protein [Halarcobacter bivalviorum]AXH12758.1 HD superfamily phosphohydrolase [Halarcobacter bivalviorum]
MKGNTIQNRLINDTIYNHIPYTKLEDKILQTKILNRLQFITQNALAYFSYPSITTKRFIHSLGTMHLSSYIFKNSLLNANKETKNQFLKDLKRVIKAIVQEEKLNINFDDLSYFDNKALYEFTIPTKNKKDRAVYTIFLQAIRIAGLMHDVGHLPFSHQIENALKKVYYEISKKEKLEEKELEFIKLYEDITKNSTLVLHEAIGKELIKLLFEFEIFDFIKDSNEKELIKLIKTLCIYILEDRVYKEFNFSTLHKIIDSTVDADRLDYINRDMLASGYITGPSDHIRITKQAVLVKEENSYHLSFFDMGLIDIEHMLEMRFNLYKKVIYNHGIAKTDALLENVVQFLSSKYFESKEKKTDFLNGISLLWDFQKETNTDKKLDLISILDENWLISLFKNEYFTLKNKNTLSHLEKKYKYCFEEVLFGKRFFRSPWKNLNEFYKVLGFSTVERYQFRESFGYITPKNLVKLQGLLDNFIKKWENQEEELFFTYQTVSFKIGIQKDFSLYDCENLINLDEISTLRKRLKQSMRNTVPFYLYTNKKNMNEEMKEELKTLVLSVFKD